MNQNRIVLAALSLGFLTVTLDATALAVALPDISESFGGSISSLQWISNGFVLAFAGFILSAGRLSDRFGPRAMFLVGSIILAVSSLVCTVATHLPTVIGARVVQGLAGAILTTASYSLIAHKYTGGPERSKAFAMLAFCGTVGLAAGPIIGGILIQISSWRAIFAANIVVALILLAVQRLLDSGHDDNKLRLDLPGQILSIVMLTGLTAFLIQGHDNGWHKALVTYGLVAMLAAVLFVVVEHYSHQPMLPLSIFRNKAFSAGVAIIGLWRFSLYGLIFFLGLYLQETKGYDSFTAGIAYLPLTAGPFITNALSAPLSNRYGAKAVAIGGMALSASGGFILLIDPQPSYTVIAVGLFCMSAGAGAGIPAVGNAALSDVPKSYAGAASGVYNAGGQTGSLVGVAIIGGFAVNGTLLGPAIALTAALLTTVLLSVLFMSSDRRRTTSPSATSSGE